MRRCAALRHASARGDRGRRGSRAGRGVQYSMVVYLDSDFLVVRSIDDLFDRQIRSAVQPRGDGRCVARPRETWTPPRGGRPSAMRRMRRRASARAGEAGVGASSAPFELLRGGVACCALYAVRWLAVRPGVWPGRTPWRRRRRSTRPRSSTRASSCFTPTPMSSRACAAARTRAHVHACTRAHTHARLERAHTRAHSQTHTHARARARICTHLHAFVYAHMRIHLRVRARTPAARARVRPRRHMMVNMDKYPSYDGGDQGFLNSFFPGWSAATIHVARSTRRGPISSAREYSPAHARMLASLLRVSERGCADTHL